MYKRMTLSSINHAEPRYVKDSPDHTEIPLYDLIAIEEHEFYQPNDKIGKAPVKITSVSECKTDRSSVHLKTNKGDWCISLHSKVYV